MCIRDSYKTIGEVRERFEQLVALACIVNYKSYGSGHVKEYLEKYSEVYQKAGCDYSKLDGITGKSDFYAALVGSNAGTLAALAGTFNSYKEMCIRDRYQNAYQRFLKRK